MHRTSSFSSQTTATSRAQSHLARSSNTDDLLSVDDRMARKPKHDAHQPYYFPNGEVFRPRSAPSRRHRPPKIHTEKPVLPPISTSYQGAPPGRPGFQNGPTHLGVPGAGPGPFHPGAAHPQSQRSNSLVSTSSAVSAATAASSVSYMTRSHSFNNLKAKSRSDLAHSLRNNRGDTNINIANFSAPSTPSIASRPSFPPVVAHPGQYNSYGGPPSVPGPANPAFLHSRTSSLANNKYPENSTNIVKSESSLYTPTLLVDPGAPRGRSAALDSKSSDSKNSSLSSYNIHLNRSSSTTPQTSVTASEASKDHDSVDENPLPLPTCSSLESIRESAAVASEPTVDDSKESDTASSRDMDKSSASSFTSADYGDASAASGASTPHKEKQYEQSSVHEKTHSGNVSLTPYSPHQREPTPSVSSVSSSSVDNMVISTADVPAVASDEDALASPAAVSANKRLFTAGNDVTETLQNTSDSEEKGDNIEPSAVSSAPVYSPKQYRSLFAPSPVDVKNSANSQQNGVPEKASPTQTPEPDQSSSFKREQSLRASIQNSESTISQGINDSSETLHPKTRLKPASIDTSKVSHLEEEVLTPRSDYSFAAGEESLIFKKDVMAGSDEPKSPSESVSTHSPKVQITRERTEASISHILDAYSEPQFQESVESHDSQPLPEPQEQCATETSVVESTESEKTAIDESTDKEILPNQHVQRVLDSESLNGEKPLPEVNVPSEVKDGSVPIEVEPAVVASVITKEEPEEETFLDASEGHDKLPSETSKKPPSSPMDLTFDKSTAPADDEKNSLIRNRLSMYNVVNVDFDKNLPSTPQDMKFTVPMPDSVSPATRRSQNSPEKPSLHRTTSLSKSFSINNFKKVFSRFGGDSSKPAEVTPIKKESFGGKLLRKKASFSSERTVEKNHSSSSSTLSTTASTTASSKNSKRKFFKTIKIIPAAKKEEIHSPVYSVRAKMPSPILESFRDETPAVNHYSLPTFETEDNSFSDVLLKFDEVEKDLALEDEQLHTKPKSDAFFMKDDELTKAQIADQQRNDNHNSDENLAERFEESTSDASEGSKSESDISADIPWSPGYDEFVSGKFTASTEEGPKRVQSLKLDRNQLQEMLDKKAQSNHFIKHVRQMRDMDSVEIVVEAFNPNEKTEPPNPIGKEMNSILKTAVVSNGSSSKAVKFSSKVSISETYPSYVYRRYNKSVTQYNLTGSGEVNKIKNELNAYKCYEMLVHEKSQNNTQFFY